MKAVVWRGDRTLDIENIEDARIEASTDVLMRITSSAICGTDLHIYEELTQVSVMPLAYLLAERLE